jgi:nitroimidazol reductase NimA-like FMN-containing flavoprotein (pyridoxamine 5'-phosphate oxidase superfamily)
MEIDRNGLTVLSREECLRHLATATVGRVAITSQALPMVLPVNFRLTDRGVVFSTGRGSKLEAATREAVVAFEADEIDRTTHTGWSVVVTGTASEITDLDELEAVRSLPLAHWGVDAVERYVRVSLELVSGRRIEQLGGRLTASGVDRRLATS